MQILNKVIFVQLFNFFSYYVFIFKTGIVIIKCNKYFFQMYLFQTILRLTFQELHPRGSTQKEALATHSVEKKSRAYILYYKPPNIGAKRTVLMRAFKWYVI